MTLTTKDIKALPSMKMEEDCIGRSDKDKAIFTRNALRREIIEELRERNSPWSNFGKEEREEKALEAKIKEIMEPKKSSIKKQ